MVGLDVDGVMTDAGVYVGEIEGVPVEFKRFDIQDNLGIRLMRDAGLKVVVVSGRMSAATTHRARELGVDAVVQDPDARKVRALQNLLDEYGAGWDEVAYLGDDLPDIPVLDRALLPVAVRNAQPEVKRAATYVCRRRGGHGAVREFARAILTARGEWDDRVDAYLAVRERGAE